MYELYVSEAELDRRRRKLPQRLKPLVPDVSYMQGAFHTLSTYQIVIGVHQGQKGQLSYQQWRVSLMTSPASVGYFEVWQYSKARGGNVSYLLQKAYLHIYLPSPSGVDRELLFLHCDPQEPKNSPHYRYKVGPHLHFEIAGPPWKDAHIPLCDGWQEKALQNLDDLDKAISRGVDFIADEFLPLLRNW